MPEQPELAPLVYAELRRMADAVMARERPDHTLQPTALAHEVWLRLSRSKNVAALDHGAFLGLAAQAMRRILTDHARRRATEKRGAGLRRTTISGLAARPEPQDFALDLDAALTALATVDPDLARLAELRFYGGQSVAELAATLHSSERSVKRHWRLAVAWLQQHMFEEER
ncbi:MAG: ECF-type sigma factor [bacterium]|nr:ECF-type sigma factor [bacterium]